MEPRHRARLYPAGAMADFVDLRVQSAPLDALSLAQQALTADGFRITAQTEWTCVAEKGKSGTRVLVGGFAERSIIELSVFDDGNGTTILRLKKQASGWSGGYLGAQKAKKAFEAATQQVGSSLQDAGLLA